MAQFNQQGVVFKGDAYQAETINIGSVQKNVQELLSQMRGLDASLAKQASDGQVTKARGELQAALLEAEKEKRDKSNILSHLTEVKTVLQAVAGAGALVTATEKIIEFAHRFF